MIAVLQRVKRARCLVDAVETGRIEKGLLLLVGVAAGDTAADAEILARKIAKCRIFSDAQDKFNLSLLDVGGGALVISNFTLLADYAHGNRPSYFDAAAPDAAQALYLAFGNALGALGVPVAYGSFGAHMEIESEADGPVTIVMDSNTWIKKENGHETAH